MTIQTLLLIDTDGGFFDRFAQKIEEEAITDKYQVKMLKPDTNLKPAEMARKVVSDTGKIVNNESVCAIFVDIVIYERSPLDQDGILIAEELRKVFPEMLIFNVTAKPNDPASSNMDHFAWATLGSVDGVFPKSFLEGALFSTKRLALILKYGMEKRQNIIAEHQWFGESGDPVTTSIPPGIEYSFNVNELDGRVAAQIEELGAGSFWGLIKQLLVPGGEGVLSYVAPGASGAYVFEAKVKFKKPGHSPTGAKRFLVKISTSASDLREECRNMADLVLSPVSREHFPKLLHGEPISFGGLCGIAYEFETNHETLLTYLARELRDGRQPGGLGQELVNILCGIYGDPKYVVKNVWRGCYSLDASCRIRMRGYIMENRPVIEESVIIEDVKSVEDFLLNDGEVLRSMSYEIDTRVIHGDFNCGNILIDSNHGSDLKISIIDLGGRRQSHIIKDAAKLERDIIFRVFDWGSLSFHDPNRIAVWRQFLQTIMLGKVVDSADNWVFEDRGVVAAAEFIKELRSAIKKVDMRWDEKTYLVALLQHALLAILHPRVSTAKKVFAVEYAGSIIQQLQQAKFE